MQEDSWRLLASKLRSMRDHVSKEVEGILRVIPMAGLRVAHAWAHKGTHIKNSKKPVAEAVTKY